MKDQLEKHVEPEETFSEALKSVVQKIEVNANFKAELGKQLAEAHQSVGSGFGQSVLGRAMPAFGWVFALALMALVLNWMFRSIAPPPIPAAQETSSQATQDIPSPSPTDLTTPTPSGEGYDWRGAKLFLAQPLPESPAEANVYQLKEDQQVTPDEARALASRFGLPGEMYTASNDYYFTDGKQALEVYSNRRFTYTADLAKARTVTESAFIDDAEMIIREFLNARGFDFPFKITPTDFFDGYNLEPLAPDGLTIQYESFTFPPMLIKLDENGEVFSINATLVDYDSTPLGTYGIISAQEALNNVMNDNEQGGKKEFFHSADSELPQTWYRVYPDAQTVTVYGYVASNLPVNPSQSPFITIDGVPAIGNVSGLEQLEHATLIEATGQYLIQDGLRQFDVDSWTTNIEPVYITATVQSEGDQIILTISDAGTDWQAPLVRPGKEYPLIDPPADLPLDNKPNSQLSVQGMLVDGKLDWYYIQYFENTSQMGGGGGGGGLGFYQLNLSGTPVPFPTPIPQPKANQGNVEYIVKEGDTVFAIAEAYGITPEIIVQANSWLDSGALTPGKTLIIPLNSRPNEYVVTENDTLASIALNFGISVDELRQSNGIFSNTVFTGQILVIPSPQPQNPLIGKRFENQRGLFILNIYPQPDGNQRKEYAFAVMNENENYYLILEGDNLEALEKYHNRPVNIWATIESVDQFGSPTAKVDRFEIPFPDLPIQILKGTQKFQNLEGNLVLTFLAEDGTTYVQLGPAGDVWNQDSIFGKEGDLVFVEALVIPDETFAGYPALRTFTVDYVIDPNSGQGNEMTVTADQPYVMEELIPPENYTPPNLTIDQVKLVYYASNPYYQVNDPNYSQRSPYIQPAWHFIGHYDDGTEFDMLIQAIKQEFLLPELAPGLSPG